VDTRTEIVMITAMQDAHVVTTMCEAVRDFAADEQRPSDDENAHTRNYNAGDAQNPGVRLKPHTQPRPGR
jgi:hypothetical protein